MKLMFITNDVELVKVAEKAGVDRIFVDLEKNGKLERQGHIDSVKSNHTLEDVKIIKDVIKKSELLVRINPMFENSESEINKVISNGADLIMLPMWKTIGEVKMFLKFVDKRCKTILLLETKEALEIVNEVVKLKGIDEIFIGLNDLHLSYKKKCMFELLTDGTVEKISDILKNKNITFGFGGIGTMNQGVIPADLILSEHFKMQSSSVILSRSFLNNFDSETDLNKQFETEVKFVRHYEEMFSNFDRIMLDRNHKLLNCSISQFVRKLEQ